MNEEKLDYCVEHAKCNGSRIIMAVIIVIIIYWPTAQLLGYKTEREREWKSCFPDHEQ